MYLLLTAVSRTVTQLHTCDTVTCMCSKLMKNFEILIYTQYIQTQALTNRPLERTEPLKRKASWKTEAQSVKRSTQKKKEPSQVSIRTKTTSTMIMNKKLGGRRPKRMPYEESIGRNRSPTEC